jgi:hypothetical protein
MFPAKADKVEVGTFARQQVIAWPSCQGLQLKSFSPTELHSPETGAILAINSVRAGSRIVFP